MAYYSRTEEPTPPQFVPISQAPELATAIRCASFPDDDVWECVVDCRKDRGIVMSPSALWPSSGPFAVIDRPAAPDAGRGSKKKTASSSRFQRTDVSHHRSGILRVYTYEPWYCEEEWDVRTVPEIQPPEPSPAIPNPHPSNLIIDTLPPVNGTMYMATTDGYILVLDLTSASISAIKLPNRVRTTNFKILCREEDAGLFVHG